MEMKANTVRELVLEEIRLLPEEELPAILSFIHSFRSGSQILNKRSNQVMRFAGSWRDLPEETYNEFIGDIAKRRQAAFSRRRDRETDIS